MMGKILDVLGFRPEDDFEDDYFEEEYDGGYVKEEYTPKSNKIFPLSGKKPNLSLVNSGSESEKQQVFILRPKDFSEGLTVVDRLKENRVVVFSVEDTDYEMGTRIVDFVSGACYARDGHIQKISRNIFIAVPSNIEIGRGYLEGEFEDADSILSWAKKNE